MRLQIGDTEVIPRRESKPLQDIMEAVMSDKTNNTVKRLLKESIGSEFKDNPAVGYDLLWYLCISEDPFRTHLTNKERAYVLSAPQTELQEMLGERYNGSLDRASMLFTAFSGQIIPPVADREGVEDNHVLRYDQIKQYSPGIVYNLAFTHNTMIDHNQGRYNIHGPYVYLSTQPPSPIEKIIASADTEDHNSLIERLDIGPIFNLDYMTESDKIMYLQGELSLYHNVFSRDPDIESPPPLDNMTKHEMMEIMSRYTNVELIQAYEPRSRWNSRNELLRLICDDVLNGPKWSIHSVLYCTNDNTINIISGDNHSDIDKHDIQDPTLSYGIHKNYRCYQASELEASFRDYEAFMFRVPDWTPDSQIPGEFPIDSIKQLKTLLDNERNRFNVVGLINKIQQGLELLKSATMQTRHLKQILEQFTFEQRQIVELYLAWMFTYSMWMRFWKGPGYPWPLIKVNVRREADRNRNQRSSPQERDEYIFIQEGVRTAIIEMYETDITLSDWIESLPTIYYDFDTGEASCATHNIKSILDQIALGDYCMGFGSDTILKTSYYYITNVLDYTQGHLFDEFIERTLPRLLDLEYTSVTDQLNSFHTPGIRLDTLRNRLQTLQEPIPKQPPFNPSTYQNNIHTE